MSSEALDRLMPIVYNELHRLAHIQLRGEARLASTARKAP
jgi:hypothetical protein